MKKNEKLNNYKTEVCIVGLGPAGIGVALKFLDADLAIDVTCLDAGNSSTDRLCSIFQNNSCKKEDPCQIISGFGGCSLFGAKISAFPAGSGLVKVLNSRDLAQRKLSEAFRLLSNYIPLRKPSITQSERKSAKELFGKMGFEYKYYDAYLYNQEDLQKAYQKIFLQLNSAGMLLLNTKIIQIEPEKNGFKLVAIHDGRKITIFTSYLILGVGRLGRPFLKLLNSKLNLGGNENHLDVGVRLEFPTDLYPDINKYHNDLKLLFNNARTFCICKDGKIATYLFEGVYLTEGYYDSNHKSGFTNLGILIRLKPSKQNEVILNEIKKRSLQISNGMPGRQRLPDYLGICAKNLNSARRLDSSISFWIQKDVSQYFPQLISIKIKEAVRYFASQLLLKDRWDEVSVFAPEIDYGGLSFPVNTDFSIIPRMYLIGDCTGRFRGILQAVCSGIICAESIIGDKK
jgi:uncharacterized FAD-dependent dehydrogenase